MKQFRHFRHLMLLLGATGLLLITAFRYFGPALPQYGQPLLGPMLLTGTFGELRSNHFHGGLDLRGATGTPVYSIGEGYISRIVVDNGGFGQALYVDHPEGFTSVYGHLHRFADSITALVRREQYDRQSFELDLDLAPGAWPVARGEKIGEVGNRGYSFGSHLHFEIRHTRTEHFMNPLAFGYSVTDTRPPRLRRLRLYELDSRGNELMGTSYDVRRVREGEFQIRPDTLRVGGPHFGLAIGALDQQNGLYNWNGIYGARLWRDTTLLYEFLLDDVPVSERRYLNAHADYTQKQVTGKWYHRLYRMPGNELPIYKECDGQLMIAPGEVMELTVELTDFAGNQSHLPIVVKREAVVAPASSKATFNYFLPYDEASIIDDGTFHAFFPEGTLYEDCYLQYRRQVDLSEDIYSDVVQLHEPLTPLHRPVELALRPRGLLPAALRNKAVLALCPPGKQPVSLGGQWDADGRLSSKTMSFGPYCIQIDTVPPVITPRFGRADFRRSSSIRFRIEDNFATGGPAKDLQVSAWVDGEWVLFEYDLKNKTIFHQFDGHIERGTHDLRVEVTDDRGNTGVWGGTFRR